MRRSRNRFPIEGCGAERGRTGDRARGRSMMVGAGRNSWLTAGHPSDDMPLRMAAPEGGDELVAQGVSPGKIREKGSPPPKGGGSALRCGIQRPHVIRPASGAAHPLNPLNPGLTPSSLATSLDPLDSPLQGFMFSARCTQGSARRSSFAGTRTSPSATLASPWAIGNRPVGAWANAERTPYALASLESVHKTLDGSPAGTNPYSPGWSEAEPWVPSNTGEQALKGRIKAHRTCEQRSGLTPWATRLSPPSGAEDAPTISADTLPTNEKGSPPMTVLHATARLTDERNAPQFGERP